MTTQNQKLSEKKIETALIEKILNDKKVRSIVTCESHYWFFNVYFSHYVTYETAEFQKELFALTEDESIRNLVAVSFRGSGKSTLMTLSYPIWAILGKQQKKHIMILSQTMPQAKQYLKNIKDELEKNDVLRNDLGPFKEETDEWRSFSLVLPKYNARITAASSEQSIRGIRHGAHRPDLIILDDVEDLNSSKTRESRDSTYNWVVGDVIPLGDKNTRTIFIGNLLHEDCLLMRLKNNIENNTLDGLFKMYPLLDDNENIAWPGKYPDINAIEAEKKKIGSEPAWQREFLLRIIPDKDRIFFREWIKTYDNLPDKESSFSCTGVDLAISESDSADYTAMVTTKVYGYGDNTTIYVLPNPIYERMDFLKTVNCIKEIRKMNFSRHRIYIEDVGYQRSTIQYLKAERCHTEPFQVHGQDKRSRLITISHLIQEGRVLFPAKGAELLIQQLVGFGIEKHDDLADAFAMAIHKSFERASHCCRIATHKER